MPSRAHVHRLPASIALIALPAATILSISTVFADETSTAAEQNAPSVVLPALGNTNEMDRYLSREVNDEFVFSKQTQNETATDKPVSAEVLFPQATESVAAQSGQVIATSAKNDTQNKLVNDSTDQAQVEPWLPVFDEERDTNATVWQLIEKSDRLPLMQNERVNFYAEQYQREALWISKILHRGKPFLAHLVATLDQRFMPLELALLPAIESGYQPTAKSAGQAAGLWQIVPITAREIGVTRDTWFDGRSDILVSTTAAIDYLSYLNAEFNGDWELTLAAYNAGPGRVRAAVRKNEDAGLPTDYWSLDLPQETMNYVPKLIALVRLVKRADRGGFDMPVVPMEPAFESIDVGFRISIDKAAKLADIDADLLRSLNAGLIHGVTAPEGPHHILIPAGSGEQFQQAFVGVDRKTLFAEPKTHDVAAGDTISSIALKYGLSQKELLSMNGLDNAKIRIGQKLAVLDSRNISESVVEYVVTIGDTLSEIAHKFSVKISAIKLSNGNSIDGDVIHPGDTLNIVINEASAG